MAAAQILAIGSTAADSSDITVAAGTPLTVSLKGVADGEAYVAVFLKDDASVYNVVGCLTSHDSKFVASGPGVYRFSRRAGATCGVFSG